VAEVSLEAYYLNDVERWGSHISGVCHA